MIGVSNEKIRKIEVSAKNAVKKLGVAAYCRVSTKYESQRSSIELQKAHYENFIQEQPNWLFAGVYVDCGSRCRIKKRTEFQKMIQRALNGEIDCVITRSISRFSGNTVDMLQVIRVLKEKGVTVWFEKENIRSTDKNIELVITIHTMLAQEEIRNMSENIQWGFKRKFEQGVTLNNYKYFYGYDVVDGELVINEPQAEVVKDIYDWYLQGMSLGQIKSKLEENHIKTASYFIEDYLTGKKVKNIGQRDSYYVQDSHPGIITKEKFLEVACEMNRRKNLTVNVDDKMIKMNRKYMEKDDYLFLGDFVVSAEASDNVGNIKLQGSDSLAFTMDADIKRAREPQNGDFQAGDGAIFTITTGGCADKIIVRFPDELIRLNLELNKEYVYEFRKAIKTEVYEFNIPLATPGGMYVVEVEAWKSQGESI